MSHIHTLNVPSLESPFARPARRAPREDPMARRSRKVRRLLDDVATAAIVGPLFAVTQIGPLWLICRVVNG